MSPLRKHFGFVLMATGFLAWAVLTVLLVENSGNMLPRYKLQLVNLVPIAGMFAGVKYTSAIN